MPAAHTSPRLDRDDARPFDFRHPSTLSRDDARTLQVLQETLAHGIGTTLASAVRASIDVTPAGVEQTPHGEFVRRTPNPSSLSMIRLDGLAPLAILQIDPALSFAIVELLLGGPGTSAAPQRPHTEIEEALMGGLVERMRASIDEAFEPITPVTSTVIGPESNPTFVQMASATDMVVSIGLDVGVDEVRGSMRLVLPVHALRPHLDALATDPVEAPRDHQEQLATQDRVSNQLGMVDVVASVRFDPLVASSHQLLELAVGDIVALTHGVDEPLVLEIDGVPLHDVSLGRIKRNLAVEIGGPAPSSGSRRPSRLAQVTTASATA